MKTKNLVIGIIKKGNTVLMRKKPEGSLPYKETWYLFGGELTGDRSPEEALKEIVGIQTGIEIELKERISWDTETKKDLDGEEKLFVYLNTICEYISGELAAGEGIEKLEWIETDKLSEYDIVPPSKKLFEELDWLN